MTSAPGEQYLAAFSDALVVEIKVEMGRREIPSSRALGALLGWSSQYVSSRLDGGLKATGNRVTLNARDLAAIGVALGVHPATLVERAQAAVGDFEIEASRVRWEQRRAKGIKIEDRSDLPTLHDARESKRSRMSEPMPEAARDEDGE